MQLYTAPLTRPAAPPPPKKNLGSNHDSNTDRLNTTGRSTRCLQPTATDRQRLGNLIHCSDMRRFLQDITNCLDTTYCSVILEEEKNRSGSRTIGNGLFFPNLTQLNKTAKNALSPQCKKTCTFKKNCVFRRNQQKNLFSVKKKRGGG